MRLADGSRPGHGRIGMADSCQHTEQKLPGRPNALKRDAVLPLPARRGASRVADDLVE